MSTILILQLCMSNIALSAPHDLEVTMTLQSGASCDVTSFNRIIRFRHGCDLAEFPDKDIKIHFVRESRTPCKYTGKILDENNRSLFQSMGEVNNRSYWDHMYLVNKGWSTTLPISELEVRVRYLNDDGDLVTSGISDGIISGITSPGTLTAPSGTLALSNWKWRACNACRALNDYDSSVFDTGCDGPQEINACVNYLNSHFSRWTREMIYDLGKTGTDDDTYYAEEYEDYCSLPGNEDNPKYGVDPNDPSGGNGCAETTSWYYSRYAYTCDTNKNPDCYSYYVDNFTDRSYNGSFSQWFAQEGRLYCKRKDERAGAIEGEILWQRCLERDSSNKWKCKHWGDSDEDDAFIEPVEGDLLFWYEGMHVSTVIHWDQRISFNKTKMVYGSNMKVAKMWPSYEFCIGRIPDNDGY
jgi:hypothetical protein